MRSRVEWSHSSDEDCRINQNIGVIDAGNFGKIHKKTGKINLYLYKDKK